MTLITHITADTGLTPGLAAEDGAKSFRRMIWEDDGAPETATKVAVWIAEPGIYPYPPRDLEETFVVLEGEAMCSLGGAAPQKIGPGSIVRVPKGVAPWLHVLTPFRKLATVVPKP
ncbi:cupin domain-containing protein [Tabrizicola sp.]|uniref:cupin domain-containing protein n=1 Tax=Tabrizicola sp. TaxID=2005166 RepID=UPI0035AF70F4